MTTWYCVTSMYNDNDILTAVTGTLEAAEKPENTLEVANGNHIWVDWFESLEEAELFAKAMLADDKLKL